MPKYRITAPDGGTYEITAPDGATQDQVLSFAQSQFGGGKAAAPAAPVDTPDPERQRLLSSAPMRLAKGAKDGIDGAAQLLQHGLNSFAPGLVSGINKAADAIGGEGTFLGDVLGIKGATQQQLDADIKNSNAEYEAARKANAPATVSSLVTGQKDPGFDAMRLAGNIISPVNAVVPGTAGARTAAQLAVAGAKAGAVSGVLQPVMDTSEGYWGQKAGQAAMGAVGGAVATPVIGKAVEKGATAVNNAVSRLAPTPSPQTIRVQVNNILQQEGMNPRDVPQVILDSVQRQINEATAAGRRLDPNEIVRRARFDAVGLTGDAAPTAGQLTRNPTQYANEINLSQVRMTGPDGRDANALADRFNAQNRRLQDVFNNAGAREATDGVTAGQTIMGALREADQPVRAGVDDAYAAARAMTGGRAAPLDHGAFSQAANRALDEGMLGHYVPPEIRNMLNDVTTGRQPFTVEAAQQFDSIMSAAQRRAGEGSPQAMAIGRIRQALHNAPFAEVAPAAPVGESAAAAAARTVDDINAPIQDVPFRETTTAGQRMLPAPGGNPNAVSFQIPQPQPGAGAAGAAGATAADEGAAAREAFAQARAAARQRFATIEDTPALRAALDEEAPDKFVQRYILGANARDVEAMRRVLANSPEALAQARAQIADHLRRAAFGANVSGDKAFTPERYDNVLRAIGPQKLQAFFSPDEIVRFNLASRVASDMNSVPAGAKPNFSGTGGALFNLLSRIAEAPVVRQIPGARALANQVTEIRNERLINQALQPPVGGPQPPRELPPEALRALQALYPALGIGGGVLGGAAVGQ